MFSTCNQREWCVYLQIENAVFILCKSLTSDKRCLYSSKGNFDSHKNRFSTICVHQRKCWLKALKKEMLRLFALEVFIVKEYRTVIQFRLNQCLIWHLHCRGSKWDPCWNCAIKDTSECYIWHSMSCLSGAEIQKKLSRLEPSISSIPIQYCTIEPHLLIQKSRQYVN